MSNHRVTVVLTLFHRITLLPIALAALLTASGFLPACTPAAKAQADLDTPPGTVFRDKLRSGGEGPAMVVIPAGRFEMGGYGDGDELPAHEVRITRPFAMGQYEVTFAEYDRYVQATGRCKPNDEGWGRGNLPVINVSWREAQAYARWLSRQTGKKYRLPTEAEWEYAASAGSVTDFFWGDDPSGRHANAHVRYFGDGWLADDYEYTAPVGSFLPNQFGLYDVSGNVWEWVEDCWHNNYKGAPEDGSAWVSGGECSFRISRGGSFDTYPGHVRSANRSKGWAATRSVYDGFRLARTL